jgi:hypothetical protein
MGSTSCSIPGSHGWCRGVGTLNITADEPMSGYVITGIESSLGGMLCTGLNAAHATCAWTFPQGSTSLSFWALSTYGDQSSPDSAAMNVDSGQPLLDDNFTPGVPGLRGWYQGGPVTLTCSAYDEISGMDSLAFTGGVPIAGGVQATAEGADTLTCTATDMAGNVSTASHPANIDSVPPTLEILYNGDPDPGGWSGTQVHITATASDATSGVYAYGFSVNGGPLETDLTLGDGYYQVEGYAEDTAGNVTATTAIVGVDTTPPATEWSLASGDWVRGTVTLRGRSDDAGSGVAAVYISFDGDNWIRAGSDPDWAYEWDTTKYGDGPHMILARATDVAGNEEHTAKLLINVDNTPPVVDMQKEWTAPSAGDAGGWDAASGIARARVTISGHGIAPRVMDYGSVPASIAWDGKDGDGKLTAYGDYQVTLEAWDRAGNYSAASGVIHRLAPPTVVAPTKVPAVPAAPTAAPTKAPEIIAEPATPAVQPPLGLPFWSMILPLGGLGMWLTASNVAFARDRRWRELRGIRHALARYRDQNKINFTKEGEND